MKKKDLDVCLSSRVQFQFYGNIGIRVAQRNVGAEKLVKITFLFRKDRDKVRKATKIALYVWPSKKEGGRIDRKWFWRDAQKIFFHILSFLLFEPQDGLCNFYCFKEYFLLWHCFQWYWGLKHLVYSRPILEDIRFIQVDEFILQSASKRHYLSGFWRRHW